MIGPDYELLSVRPQPAVAKAVASVAEPTTPAFVGMLPAIGPSLATGALLGTAVALVRVRKRWAARNAPIDRMRALDVGIAMSGAAGFAALGLTAIAAGAPAVPYITYSRQLGIQADGGYVVRLSDPESERSIFAAEMPAGVRPVSVKLSTIDLPDRAACVQATIYGTREGRGASKGESVAVKAGTFFAEERSWVPAARRDLDAPCPKATGEERSVNLPAYPAR